MARRIELIAFDLDGTLIDSRRDLTDSVNALLLERDASPLAEAQVTGMIGSGAHALVARAFDAAGLRTPTPPDHTRFLSLYEQRLLVHTRPYDGVPALLDTLYRARRRLVVLTNKPLAPTRRILDGLRLSDRFSAVVGGDGPGGRKPDPTALRQLMADAGARQEGTLFVGDSHVDLETARNAGVTICLARYGFGFPSIEIGALAPSELVVDTPAQILAATVSLERSS